MNIKQLEHDLRTYRPSGFENLPDNFVWPRYEGLSVGNLAATIGQVLGAPLEGALPPMRADLLDGMLDGVKHVVLLVMDALGWEQLCWVMDNDPDSVFHSLSEKGQLMPITTSFLSTTTSVLSTIWSGYAPLQHGQLAYEMFLREWEMAVESIAFSSTHESFKRTLLKWGFEPEKFQPMPAIGEQLAAQGVPSYALTFTAFVESPLSKINHRGMKEICGYKTASDFWLTVRRALEAHRDDAHNLITGYWSAVDGLAHTWGPYDETGDAEIRALAWQMNEIFLKRLAPADREGTLLLITADHGQITAPAESAVLLDDHPDLYDALFMRPLGESRVPFFHVRHGQYDQAREYIQTHLAETFVPFSQPDLIASGLLGPGEMYAEVPHRLGDIVAIAKGPHFLAHDPENVKKMRGRHGGLHAQEMLVPLLAVRLDA